jgi:hypothetical protein
MKTIIVNGVKKQVGALTLSFEQLVRLAFGDIADPDAYAIRYVGHMDGTYEGYGNAVSGDRIVVVSGLTFTVKLKP